MTGTPWEGGQLTMPDPIDLATRRRVLTELAGSAVDHGPFQPITGMFEAQADLTPDRPALSYRDTTLTYREVDESANGLAAELTAAGVRRGDVVAVLAGNSLELPLCFLASLKLGAIFVPCDPAWPASRIQTALEVLTPRLVLTREAIPLEWPSLVVTAGSVALASRRPQPVPGPDEPAYGVFTSGTTGTPKCAINLHRGLTNRFRFMSRYFAADGTEVVLQNSRHTFDSAIWQLLWPMTTGGRTVVPEQGEFLDLERTVATILEHRITVTDFVPTTLAMLVALLDAQPAAVRRIESLRHIVVGGEEVGPRAVHRLQALLPRLLVSNGYGPSETAIGMVFHPIGPADGDHIPLGRPIDNCYAVVVDDRLGLRPPGQLGEILVGGECVGSGYHRDPNRTAEVFLPNPFPEIPGTRLYRTGDLGWFDEQGRLRFAGRRDEQVKVAGVRIELGEIETAAESCPGVRQAKAFAVPRQGRTILAVVGASDSVTPAALRGHLWTLLPRTSIPHVCLVLSELPLTDNGKVDTRALRSLVDRSPAPPAEDSGDSLVSQIARVFGQVLGRRSVEPDDDFLECGGDSAGALAAVLELRRLDDIAIGVQDLYEYRTPAMLAAVLPTLSRESAVDTAALMEQDARLAESLPISVTPVSAPRTVLITGATGFVGARVVHQLLRAGRTRLVCLVRAAADAHAYSRVVDALKAQGLWDPADEDRVEAVAGDLAEPRFGLSTVDWDTLAAQCDAVLHIGALVNFLFDYHAHRPANVLGTFEVLKFALTGTTKAVHHVSTLGVLARQAAMAGRPLPEEFDPADAVAPQSGYSQSKWVAERILLDARRRGMPVTIYRLGEMMPAKDNGVPNPRALTHLLLAACHHLGVRPDVPIRSDYTPIDEAAARLAAGLADPQIRGSALHIFHGRSVDLTEIPSLRPVTAEEFVTRLRAAGLTVLLGLLTSASGAVADLRTLLTDNPSLFSKDSCAALDRRHGLRDGALGPAIAGYHDSLARRHECGHEYGDK